MISNDGKMEKSFLNFKAANPDWRPTDPSGSLYLSRMADFTAAHPPQRRRSDQMEATVHFEQATNMEASSLADRAQVYDRALKQSQTAAARRRAAAGSTMLGASTLAPPPLASASSVFVGDVGGMSTAQTAILGDSQGSIHASSPHPIHDEDFAGDGDVVSGLGESYVDGARRSRAAPDLDEDEGGSMDKGVLGLLAQIYGRRDAPIRGPGNI